MHCTRLAPELSATSSIDRGWIIASRCAAQDLADPPALLPRQGASLLDQHAVPDPARVGLVVRLQLPRRPDDALVARMTVHALDPDHARLLHRVAHQDRKSTRLNSSHITISYAVFCLKKKNTHYLT